MTITCPACGATITDAQAKLDQRTQRWRIRIRLYDEEQIGDPVADSDPELAPDKLGETVLNGLPAVAEHLAALAFGYHQVECVGLDEATLRHRLKSIRPTLSRRGGDGTWRVPYATYDKAFDRDRKWLARVDIQREE